MSDVSSRVAEGVHRALVANKRRTGDSSPIYVWFRRNWLVLIAVLCAMWYAAISQNNSPAYLLMFFLISLVGVSAIHAHFALAGLRVRAGNAKPVFAGQNYSLPIETFNPTRRTRLALEIAPDGAVFNESTHLRLPRLLPGESAAVSIDGPAPRRGRHVIERVVLTTVYPLGFFRSWIYKTVSAPVIVYPAPIGTFPLPLGPAEKSESSVGVRAGGDDYAGARAYQPGESQRHVDWRAVARGQALLVKQFAGAGSRRVWLNYADLAAMGDFERALSQLCQWVLDAERENCLYGLRLPTVEIPMGNGAAHCARCLEELAMY